MPVTITWDALPGRIWQGVVERIATQIVRLESRQVGEVVSVIENPGRDLAPGANINVAIRSRVAENAVALPKECMRREGGVAGVYVLNGDRVSWRPLKTGVSSVARVQVLEGLKAGDLVALPTDKPLADGDEVRPVIR
jgi:HlyD family secretion protein